MYLGREESLTRATSCFVKLFSASLLIRLQKANIALDSFKTYWMFDVCLPGGLVQLIADEVCHADNDQIVQGDQWAI